MTVAVGERWSTSTQQPKRAAGGESMVKPNDYRLALGEGTSSVERPTKREGIAPPKGGNLPTFDPGVISKSLLATSGAKDLLAQIPTLAEPALWQHVATLCVCVKSGSARYLDLWDADHFDYFTDMQRNLAECRVWFSGGGHEYWGEPAVKAGRVNAYFGAPATGNYVCNVELESYGGPAQVECLIDSFSYGPLPFNGFIIQPHPAGLAAGDHSFRIRQMSGSFFFAGLTVWKV
jgi:hypothetical protein